MFQPAARGKEQDGSSMRGLDGPGLAVAHKTSAGTQSQGCSYLQGGLGHVDSHVPEKRRAKK